MSEQKHFRLKIIFLPFLVIAFLGVLPFIYSSPFFINSLIVALMFGLAAKGWDILGGYTGQFSLGHAIFFGLGAYICGISFVKFNVNPWLSMIFGTLIGSISAVLIGYPCFKLRGHYFVLATVAFSTAIQFIFLNWEYVGGAGGLWFPVLKESIYNFYFKSKLPYYYFIYAVTITTVILFYKIEKSELSLIWKAIREDEDASMSIGINASKYKAIAALMSGALTGFSGSFYTLYFLFIDPYSVMSFEISAMLVIMSVVGGSGSLIGPFVGSFIYVPLAEYIRAMLGVKVVGLHMVVFGALLIIVALFIPGGIMGFLSKRIRRLRYS